MSVVGPSFHTTYWENGVLLGKSDGVRGSRRRKGGRKGKSEPTASRSSGFHGWTVNSCAFAPALFCSLSQWSARNGNCVRQIVAQESFGRTRVHVARKVHPRRKRRAIGGTAIPKACAWRSALLPLSRTRYAVTRQKMTETVRRTHSRQASSAANRPNRSLHRA